MARDDYQLLEDYTVWQEEKLLHEVDTSVEAFKAQRHAGANAAQLEKVLSILDHAIEITAFHGDKGDEVDCPAVEFLKVARDTLVPDRSFIENRTLTSTKVVREYTD